MDLLRFYLTHLPPSRCDAHPAGTLLDNKALRDTIASDPAVSLYGYLMLTRALHLAGDLPAEHPGVKLWTYLRMKGSRGT